MWELTSWWDFLLKLVLVYVVAVVLILGIVKLVNWWEIRQAKRRATISRSTIRRHFP